MTDKVLLGVTLPQFTDDRDRFLDGARRAEAAGIDSIWVFDHLWPLSGDKQRPILESWTSLAYLAEATERVHIGTLVTRSTLRHPAVLAKMAATVGEIAPGRLIVGIGSGDEASRKENEAFGLPYWSGDDRIDQLRSIVEVLLSFLTQDEVTREDDFASIESLPASPRPRPRPSIWVGGRSGDALETAGLLADGWNGWDATPERFAQDASIASGYVAERAFEISWGGLVALGRDQDEALSRLGGRDPRTHIVGSPGDVASGLRGFVEAGASHLIAAFPDPWRPGVYESFGTEVKAALAL
jgi:alkanesulfonate monooxygenase SsuD/methylene tetrahydromethanopterin reductase-like flavin-dependent oxidoreductase (luciferase family)